MKISSSSRPQAAGAEVSGFMIYGRVSPVQRGIILSTPSVFSPRICELSHLFLAKVLIAWAKNNGHKGQFLSGFTLESGGWLFPNTHPGCAQRTTLRASFTSWSHVVQVGKAVVPPYFFQMFLTLGRVVGLKGVGEPTCDPKTAITNLWAKLRLSEGLAATLQLPFGHCWSCGDPQSSQPQIPPWQVSPLQATVLSAGYKVGGFTLSISCCFLNYLLQLCWWSTRVMLLCIVSRCLQTHSQGQILNLTASVKYSPLDWGPICVPVELYIQADCWLREQNTALKDRDHEGHRFKLCKMIKASFFSTWRPLAWPRGRERSQGTPRVRWCALRTLQMCSSTPS